MQDCVPGSILFTVRAIFTVSLMLVLACSDQRKRDPIVLEWRNKFYEVASAAKRYQGSAESYAIPRSGSTSQRIFPERIRDLSRWSESNKSEYLLNIEDWIDFERNVTVLYYTHDEMTNDGINYDSSNAQLTEILNKYIVGKNGKKYRIGLLLSGIVTINNIDESAIQGRE